MSQASVSSENLLDLESGHCLLLCSRERGGGVGQELSHNPFLKPKLNKVDQSHACETVRGPMETS